VPRSSRFYQEIQIKYRFFVGGQANVETFGLKSAPFIGTAKLTRARFCSERHDSGGCVRYDRSQGEIVALLQRLASALHAPVLEPLLNNRPASPSIGKTCREKNDLKFVPPHTEVSLS
jgi:hypothetical protein